MKARTISGEMDMAGRFAIEQPAATCSLTNTITEQIFITGLMFAAFTCGSWRPISIPRRSTISTGLKGKMNEKEAFIQSSFRARREDRRRWMTMPPFMGLGSVGCVYKTASTPRRCDGRYRSL